VVAVGVVGIVTAPVVRLVAGIVRKLDEDGVFQLRKTRAPPAPSKYSRTTGTDCPAVRVTVALVSVVSPWEVQLSMTRALLM
jgi:hypothetical protein